MNEIQHGTFTNGRLNLIFTDHTNDDFMINVRTHYYLVGLVLSLFGKAVKLHMKVGDEDQTLYVNKRSLVIRTMEAESRNDGEFKKITEKVCDEAFAVLFPEKRKDAYEFSKGLKIDENRLDAIGKEYLNSASEKGDSDAEVAVGLRTKDDDPKVAEKLFLSASSKKNSEADHQLGRLYRYGNRSADNNKIVTKNLDKSLEYLNKAASAGHVEALYDLGYIYENGVEGVPVDHSKAIEFYKKAAKQNHTLSMYNLARLYEHPESTVRDIAKGIEIYKSLAKKEGSSA